MEYILEFEKPVTVLENQIKELQQVANRPGMDISSEIKALQLKADTLAREIYGNLNPWERVLLARHPDRPHSLDYIENIFQDFFELHGDRKFLDDPSMVTGLGYLSGQKVAIIGIEKGRKTQDKIKRNFGMASPEGYRKALRIMELADRFSLPLITFIDTPGAYPGIGAEERGQSQAIADNIEKMFGFKIPIIAVIIGEGGSGGALGLAVANKVLMQEYSVYSVISPESCASILWADPKRAMDAANSLKLSPQKALELKVIDEIIEEPIGGAHRHPEKSFEFVKLAIEKNLNELKNKSAQDLTAERFAKFRTIGK